MLNQSTFNILPNVLCVVEGHIEEAIRLAFLKLDEDMTLGTCWCCFCLSLVVCVGSALVHHCSYSVGWLLQE